MHKLHLLLLFFALSTVAFVGCDSNDDEDDYSAVLGRWEALGDPVEEDAYLNVTDEALIVHFFIENDLTEDDCFGRDFAEVVSREGNRWTLREDDDPEDDEEFTLVLRRDGDDLVIEDPDIADRDGTRFERSTRTDFTPLCD
jgi:hypothetical protein